MSRKAREDKMSKVIFVSGISGSGKSTYVGKLLGRRLSDIDGCVQRDGLASHMHEKGALCSADLFFMRSGDYIFVPSEIGDAHARCFRDFIHQVQASIYPLVVVDNTGTTVAEIAPYMLGAQAFGYESEVVTIHPTGDSYTVEEYARKCAARNNHGVSYEGCLRQAIALSNRVLPPWWPATYIDPNFG